MKAAWLLMFPVVALAAPPPLRIGALLIPMDSVAESSSAKLETYASEALEQFPGFAVKKPEDLFGMPDDEAAEAALKLGGKELEESATTYEAGNYEDAERKLRAALKELRGGAGAMKACTDLCEAITLHAAVLQQRGDLEEAKRNLVALATFNPGFEPSPKRYGKEFFDLRARVAASLTATRGSAIVKSRPAGARVYVDGQFEGYTPMRIAPMLAGEHLLRLDRPGFYGHGEIFEVTPNEVEVTAVLAPTAAYRKYDAQLDKLAAEIARAESSPAAVTLGKSLAIDRAVPGVLKNLGANGTELIVGLFDLQSGKKLAGRRLVLQGDEYGQTKNEISRLVNHLVNDGGDGAIRNRRD